MAPPTSSAHEDPSVVLQTLSRALARDNVHHAYLMHGTSIANMAPSAWGLAQTLVCERRAPGESDACMSCSACLRAEAPAELGPAKHPDVIVLGRGLYDADQIGRRTPEGQELSVDQIRSLVLPHRGFGPSENKARVFLLYKPEELSTAAANTLLKTLEEPGRGTYFVLLSEQPGALLDTIRSRCFALRFPNVVADSASPVELPPELLSALAGSQGASLAIADIWKKDKSELGAHLESIERHLSARVHAAATTGDRALAERLALSSECVAEAREDLDRNVSPALAVERMFFAMHRLA